MHVRPVHLSVLEHLAHRLHRLLEEVDVELLEARAAHRLTQVHSVLEGLELDRRRRLRRERALEAFARSTEPLECSLIARDVELRLALKGLREVAHEPLVKVLASQVGVARRRLHLKHALVDREQRHVKRATSQVIHEHVTLPLDLRVEAVRNRGGGGLVDHAQYAQPRDRARVLGRLPLRVVEVRWHRHDRILDCSAEVVLGDRLHLSEHHRRNLLGRELLAPARGDHHLGLALDVHHLEGPMLHVLLHCLVCELATDQPLGVVDRVLRVGGRLVLGGVTDEPLVVRRPRHVRRRDPVALVVGDDLHAPILPDADAAVRRSQVDANAMALHLLVRAAAVAEERFARALAIYQRAARLTRTPLRHRAQRLAWQRRPC